jgi:large subunit ribosomal protein L31
MKKDIHPVYYKDAEIKCACGNVIVTGSVLKELKTDICSACHPFYTGKQKLIDSAGRVDKFMARQKAAVDKAEQVKQAALDKKSGKKGEKYMTIDEMKAIKEKNAVKAEKVEQAKGLDKSKVEKEPETAVEKVEEAQAVQGEMFFEERKVEKHEEIKPTVKAVKKAAAKKPAVKKAAVKKAPAKKPTAKAKKPAKKASK